MNDAPVTEDATNKLLKLMLDTIKTHRWEIIGREAVLWKQVIEGNGKRPGLFASEIRQLKESSEAAGGWWTDLDKEPRFVSLEQWQLILSQRGLT